MVFREFRNGALSLLTLALASACGNSGSAAGASAGAVGQGGAGLGTGQGGGAGTNASAGSAALGGAPSLGGSSSTSGASAGGAGGGLATGGAAGNANPTTAIGSGPELSPYLFGENYWNEPDIEALWPVVKASGVKMIRFGGAGADDEQPSNQRYADVAAAIRAIGAEPYLQISRHFDATRAGQIVDFVNNTQKDHVVYWSINNEPDIGANEPMMSVADTANLVMTLASAMKAVDPTILIFAPELAYYDTAYLGPMLGGANDITGKDANGRYYIDGVSFHSYAFGPTYTRDQVVNGAAAGFAGSVSQMLTALNSANQKNGRTGANALKWALTEFNITYSNPADNSVTSFGVNSFLNGQFFAEEFGVAMANGGVSVDPWSVHESNGNRGTTDLGYLDGPLGSTTPRSSYYHLQMLAQNFSGRFAPSKSSQALLRVVAAGDGNQVSVVLLNESTDQTYQFGVRLDNGQLMQPQAVTVTVDAALPAEFSGQIAPQATALLQFDATGKLTKRIDYALADAQNSVAPHVTMP